MNQILIPQYPQDITPEWLTAVLRRSGKLSRSAEVRAIALSDPGREASYAGYVVRLQVAYSPEDTAAPRSMIAKLPAPEWSIRFLFRTIYRNEAYFYRQLAGDIPIPVPECYAALLNRRRTRSMLLLEDLSAFAATGDHDTGCTLDEAGLALRRLAELHAAWWENPALQTTEWLGRYQVDSRQNWLIYVGAWLPFQYRLRHITPPGTLGLFRNLWRFHAQLKQMEKDRPRTLQHGDFRLANLAFTGDDVYAFDWQVIRSGPPLFDVAWFMLTSLTIEQRRSAEPALLETYHRALGNSGVDCYSIEELMDDFRLALLLTIPQIMVIGGFLRMDPERESTMATLMNRFEAARVDHALDQVARGQPR
jgi:thiamine kinase-like enzyme